MRQNIDSTTIVRTMKSQHISFEFLKNAKIIRRRKTKKYMNYILFFKSGFPLCHSQTVCLHVNVRSQNYWSSVDLIMWHCLMLPPLIFFTTANVQIVHWILYGILIYLLILTIFLCALERKCAVTSAIYIICCWRFFFLLFFLYWTVICFEYSMKLDWAEGEGKYLFHEMNHN